MLSDQIRLLRTVSHLKPRQILFQVLRRLGGVRRIETADSLEIREKLRMKSLLTRRSGGEAWAMTFLAVRKAFDKNRFDWDSTDQDKLWRYNLHYFDYLQEPDRDNGPELIDSWIASNPQGTPDAWEPFPVSLRIVNWIKYFLTRETPVPETWLHSLALQARWLEGNIEYHLLANHYFKNGKALVFAGTFFQGQDAARWLSKGTRIILEELEEQILPDGGHFERSPMYHAMILEDCLDLLNLCQGSGHENLKVLERGLEKRIPSMLDFTDGMTHPDGEIALFNDAAFDIEPTCAELVEYASRLGVAVTPNPDRIRSFPQSGYFRLSPRPGDLLLMDCGPIGPGYQPGHAHCDTLSFELSLDGRRVIVDSGCRQYIDGPIRQYNRGSMGHNSLIIDGENQSEVWGAHRVARRARPVMARSFEDGESLICEGAHDGYTRLPGKPVHSRRILWKGSRIEILDAVEGLGTHDIELRLHVHPNISISHADRDVILDGSIRVSSLSGDISLEEGWYCPKFGQQDACTVIVVRKKVALPWSGGFTLTKEN
jgi:uncharacterized heparinase superfamily protein